MSDEIFDEEVEQRRTHNLEEFKIILKRLGYKFKPGLVPSVVSLPFKGKIYVVNIDVYVGSTYLVFHGILPISIPKEAFPELLELINEINTPMPIGALEVDETMGFRSRVGVLIPPFPTDENLVGYISMIMGTLDQVAPQVASIVAKHVKK